MRVWGVGGWEERKVKEGSREGEGGRGWRERAKRVRGA